jgi:hypothetical protein
VPWWRVLRADGTVAPHLRERQLARLRAEGTPMDPYGDGVDLSRARWAAAGGPTQPSLFEWIRPWRPGGGGGDPAVPDPVRGALAALHVARSELFQLAAVLRLASLLLGLLEKSPTLRALRELHDAPAERCHG